MLHIAASQGRNRPIMDIMMRFIQEVINPYYFYVNDKMGAAGGEVFFLCSEYSGKIETSRI